MTNRVFDALSLIRDRGLDEARHAATTVVERLAIDAADIVAKARLSSDDRMLGNFAIACLPRRPVASASIPWRRRIFDDLYVLRPAHPIYPEVGLPYGSKARLILLYFLDRAVSAGSPTFAVEGSMRAWIKAMRIPMGGMTYRMIFDQSRRLAGCEIDIEPVDASAQQRSTIYSAQLVSSIDFGTDSTIGIGDPKIGVQKSILFPERVTLDASFFKRVRSECITIRKSAVSALSGTSWALDLYMLFATLLPRVQKETALSWDSLSTLLTNNPDNRRAKAKVIEILPLIKAVYPEGLWEWDERWLVLRASPAAA